MRLLKFKWENILRKVIVSDSRYALSLASVKGWNMGCNDGSAVGIKTA